MRCLVTTAPSGDPAEARELASRFGLQLEERAGRTVQAFGSDAAVLVLGQRRADLHWRGAAHRCSLGMAHLRALRMAAGEEDPLVRAAALGAGERVLDATLGLAGDALVSAQAGAAVVGLEASPVLAAVAQAALHRLPPALAAAAARIDIRCGDHRALLRELPSRSFDLVLFDPMFRSPLDAGPLFSLLRDFANPTPLQPATLHQAQRVASRGVLVKDAWPGHDLHRLGLQPLPSRRLPRVVFGWAAAE